ncbi:VOC family protein [Pacificimonas flava]|uniref:3-demethylubiquinone-9 3-methyltransferase n=1 Tax=Pacificimonas flava TaxID=1234595 RepID=M2U2X0_9SPHN|nr:VOC family protein [Pacificimonas flava]EMD82218.1 3-demethylubiquinone-9 3-methyltransferase [Pacificimonas flava]MBB5280304.1 putative 3-demethylubiquinone-9 3-methyltransferase (glyoxalase superfamily) [Pacificimonas flava]
MTISEPITFLWFDGQAEEAATLYTSLVPNSALGDRLHAPADTPGPKAGSLITVDFTLNGRPFIAMNGGPAEGHAEFNDSVSIMLTCDTQEEIDRLWDGLIEGGGEPVACGWLKDRFGLRWQITPKRLLELNSSSDKDVAKRSFEAMMTMVKIEIAALERAARGE